MSEIVTTTLIAVLIWAIGLAVFLYVLKTRWFARFEHGFFFSLMAAIGGVAVLATAHPDRSRLDSDVSKYAAVQLARQTRSTGSVVAANALGQEKLFVYWPMQNPSTIGKEPWVLLTEIDEGGEMATLMALRRELVLGGVIPIVASLVIAQQVVTFLNSYFSERVEAVFEQGGVLDKVIGNGPMATFGSLDDHPDHAQRAVRAALRMKALLGKNNALKFYEVVSVKQLVAV